MEVLPLVQRQYLVMEVLPLVQRQYFSYGSVAEWLKAAVLKTAEHASVP